MRRRFLAAFFLTLATAFASGSCAAEPVGASCVYHSKLYSEGALICLQKSLMLSCASDGTHAVWRAVTDPNLEGRCLGQVVSAYAPAARHPYRMHTAQYRIDRRTGGGGRCFDFAGKRYCE
jgi:hypothetical protein